MKWLVFIVAGTILFASCSSSPNSNTANQHSKTSSDSIPAININNADNQGEKTYWLVLLKKGPHVNQDRIELGRIQTAHFNAMQKLAELGKVVLAGPVERDASLRGIYVIDSRDSLEVAGLMNKDTSVISGRIIFEIHPWLIEKGEYQFR